MTFPLAQRPEVRPHQPSGFLMGAADRGVPHQMMTIRGGLPSASPLRVELLIVSGQFSLRFLQGGLLSGAPQLAPVPVDDHVSVLLRQVAQRAFCVRAQRAQYPEKLFLFSPLPSACAAFIPMVRRTRPARDIIKVLRIRPKYAGNDDGESSGDDSTCHHLIPLLDACVAFARPSACLRREKKPRRPSITVDMPRRRCSGKAEGPPMGAAQAGFGLRCNLAHVSPQSKSRRQPGAARGSSPASAETACGFGERPAGRE